MSFSKWTQESFIKHNHFYCYPCAHVINFHNCNYFSNKQVQIASGFGLSLCAIDIDGDGLVFLLKPN